MTDTITIGGEQILAGESKQIALPVARLYTDTEVSIPVHVINAKKPGDVVFISAAVHGDELNGIEIVRRLITQKIKLLRGTLILVPMVNVHGVLNQSRYLPDRRDLNRCFPGSAKGSLASRVAYTFLNEIVKHCQYGIDLHTGAIHRSNVPQIRANLDDEQTQNIAKAFGVPVMLNANIRDGSLREAAVNNGARVLLYEAGEALRFDEFSIQCGVKGVLNVLSELKLIRKRSSKRKLEPFIANRSDWTRANASGFVLEFVKMGARVEKGDVLAEINSPMGDLIEQVCSSRSGILIGKQNIPLVQEGEALYHIAYFGADDEEVAEHIEQLQEDIV
ncbi:succinylglutamate desuccinylase/aspartoacylase family protein [Thalassotalea sp. HSM 43]|uniref:succinylglutamate desuccinylase/aspartoacylase family protein n=1 Tax=Thalassotalea sp. HSM 43 TaxID=2552945 RepID=UPI001081F16C|nr:succinylglutamate desuccinylase/aspartoacylase family protein [Thalassotalea sp. HSM 43]QBY04456.1 succinylglutamate desuccinylase/aspartoacylase family protein [Thalassotalea sp. HSM 43]